MNVSDAEGFLEKCKFLGVVGAIDASHIRITAPQNKPDSYYNRKKVSFCNYPSCLRS